MSVFYFPMRFDGIVWHTSQAIKEKKLICGWACDEIFRLITTHEQEIKQNNLSSLQEEFYKIAEVLYEKYNWFDGKNANNSGFHKKNARNCYGTLCRFISLNQKDIFLIKTPIENQFLIAKLNDDGNGIQKENLENDVDGSYGFTKSKVSFSNLICKNNIIDALDEMLARKNIEGYNKDKLIKNFHSKQGTCVEIWSDNNKNNPQSPFNKKIQPCLFDVLDELFKNNPLKDEDEKSLIERINKSIYPRTIKERAIKECKTIEEKVKKLKLILQDNPIDDALSERTAEVAIRNNIRKAFKGDIESRVRNNFQKVRCENKQCENPTPFNRTDDVLLEFHHIVHVSKGGKNEVNNLLLLCPNCHAEIHRGNDIMSNTAYESSNIRL